MKVKNIATIAENSTAFSQPDFYWTMFYYDILHLIESSRYIAGIFINLISLMNFYYY